MRAAGMRFEPAPEYHVFPTRERPLKPYEAVAAGDGGDAARWWRRCAPDAVVADILTLAPALAAELEGVPVATVIPHLDPRTERGWPPFSLGARRPRTAVGRRAVERPVAADRRRARARAPRAQRDAPAAGARAAGARARRDLAAAGAGGDLPGARVPARGRAARDAHVGPLLWEPPAADVAAAARRRPAGAGGALDVAGPVAPAAARDAARARRRARAGPRRLERQAAGRADRRARERAPGRLALLRAGHAARATSSSATAATARSRGRWPAAARSSSSPPRAT